MGWLAYHLDRRHRLAAAENLRQAFPDLPDDEIDRRVRSSFEHLFVMTVETLLLARRITPANVGRFARVAMDPDKYREVMDLLSSQRPSIIMTGHLGNWEVMNLALSTLGHHASIVARRLDNPFLDRYIREMRSSLGLQIIDKDGASHAAEAVLQKGGILGLVGDQDAGSKGLFVEFFGRPASTFKSIALLSLQFNAPILVVACVRTGEALKHEVFLVDSIDPADYQSDPNAVRAITLRYTKALESIVRAHPEQYFWLHRRWKSQPRAGKARQAA